VFVPTNVAPWADEDRNHIHNGVGVIRLLNQFSNVVYSLAYGGYAPFSEPNHIPITDQIVITNVTLQTNRVILQTIGNDVPAPAGTPIVRFQVLSATNLLTDRPQWTTNRFTNSAADAYGGNIFYITNNPVVKPKLFYRVDPLWP
jgi:hypothetical protein